MGMIRLYSSMVYPMLLRHIVVWIRRRSILLGLVLTKVAVHFFDQYKSEVLTVGLK